MRVGRRIWLRGSVHRRPPHRGGAPKRHMGGQVLLSAVLGIGLALVVIGLFDRSLRPVVTALAVSKTENAVTRIVNDAVSGTLAAEGMDYNDMVTLEKNTAGQITALTGNSAAMNRLRTALVEKIITQVDSLDSAELGVPMGNLTGVSTLSEQGPVLPVRVRSVASADVVFSNQFTAAGINQTRHCVVLNVTVGLKLLIPGGTVETEVCTPVSVAETVIIGAVPEAYLQFGTGAGSGE